MTEPMTPSFGRCDLVPSALIFGGLLVAMTAVGGAMEGTSAGWVDEIKVVAGEDLIGQDEMDPTGACKRIDKTSAFAELARQCRQGSAAASHAKR